MGDSHNFFFQAEDGIRAADVTGVQTCALPILAPKNNLDSYASIKSCALLSLIDSSHATHTNASDDIVIAKLSAFQSQHRLRLSFPSCLPYFPGTELGEGRGTGDEVVEVGVPEPGLPVGVGLPCNPGTFSTTIVI